MAKHFIIGIDAARIGLGEDAPDRFFGPRLVIRKALEDGGGFPFGERPFQDDVFARSVELRQQFGAIHFQRPGEQGGDFGRRDFPGGDDASFGDEGVQRLVGG